MPFQTLLERRRRTQTTFSKLDDFFVEFVATKKLLVIAESLLTMLRKTTMKILQGTEDPMSFQKLLARRTRTKDSENIFKAGVFFTWIRSYKVLLMSHWGLCTPRFVKIPSVELLKISLRKSEFKNRLHWSWNRVGLMLRKTTRKERKVLQGKDHVTKKMWCKKVPCTYVRSFILFLGLVPLKKKYYVRGTTCHTILMTFCLTVSFLQ